MCQKRNHDKRLKRTKPFEVGDYVWVFIKVLPRRGIRKLLRGWRGPFQIVKKHQEGRWYVLSSGHRVHFERLKPHIGSATEWAARNAEQDKGDEEIVMFPEPQVMTVHPLPENEDVEEVSNEAETLPYMQEESNVSRASEGD